MEWVYGNLIKESEDCCISTDDIGIELDDDYWVNCMLPTKLK